MNVETILQAHGVEVLLQDVKNVKISLLRMGDMSKTLITWDCGDNPSFITEIYLGSKDIETQNYKEIQETGYLLYSGQDKHYVINTEENQEFFIKIFRVYLPNNLASSGVFCNHISKTFNYGIEVYESDPDTDAVLYVNDCMQFEPVDGYQKTKGDWKPFIDKYLSTYVTLDLSTKRETQQIDPNDWTKTTDGKTAILDGSKGDLMWKVPKLYWKFKKTGRDIYIALSNKKVDDDFVCLAHTKGNKEVNYIYYSVMLGTEKDGKLRSIDGGTPTNDKTIGDFRKLCEANGEDVHMLPYYPWLLYQIIVFMLGKDRNTQRVWGYTSSGRDGVARNLSKGMLYGSSYAGVNAFIADPWGNQWCWIDGIKVDEDGNILVGTENFNNNASGYKNVGKTEMLMWNGIDKVHGTNTLGFFPLSTEGDMESYYADEGGVLFDEHICVGGQGSDDDCTGLFSMRGEQNSSIDTSTRIFVYGK